MSQGLSNNYRHTLLTLVPSVTSLTVALAGHRVTAAISVCTVTCFSTVWTPVTCITSCNRYVTFDINREEMTHLQLKPAAVTTPALRVTFPAVVSGPAGSTGTPPARPITASIVLADTLHLTSLTETSTRTRCRRKENQMPVLGNYYSGGRVALVRIQKQH